MLDTQPELTPMKIAVMRQLLLKEFGAPLYREKNPNNVFRRFHDTLRGLEDLTAKDAGQPIVELARELQEPNGRWKHPFTLKRLRQFELTARFGRCALKEQCVRTDVFVNDGVILLSYRLRIHHSTFL